MTTEQSGPWAKALANNWSIWADRPTDHLCLINRETGERIEIPWATVKTLLTLREAPRMAISYPQGVYPGIRP